VPFQNKLGMGDFLPVLKPRPTGLFPHRCGTRPDPDPDPDPEGTPVPRYPGALVPRYPGRALIQSGFIARTEVVLRYKNKRFSLACRHIGGDRVGNLLI
jgi:hypothetical protein